MAKRNGRPDADEPNTPIGHNAKLRAETIRYVCQEVERLEANKKLIADEIAEIKKEKIKELRGMSLRDFNAAYRLYQAAQNDRDKYFDVLREVFEAQGVGFQLDWIRNPPSPIPTADPV